jgi:hypothetical protein
MRPSYGAKAIADFCIKELMKFRVSHLTETEKCWKINLIRQRHLTNILAAENDFMLLL